MTTSRATSPQMPRYVELVRVSSKGQRDRDTPAQQKEALERLRDRRPGILVERIEHSAHLSGALRVADRPDLQRLKELSEQRAFDEIRVFNIDRLTRASDEREQ